MQPKILALLAVVVMTSAHAGPGPGGGKGPGTGARDRCGGSIQVALPDGPAKTFDPAPDFVKDMPLTEINQGENPRPAIKLYDLLARVGASSVRVTDCHGKDQELPSGLPVEGEVYLVVTGRGTLKFVKEVKPGRFVNMIQNIRTLRFNRAMR